MAVNETVFGVLGGNLKLGMFRSAYAALVLTDRRLIYAFVTRQMTDDAIKKAGEKAKAEGKGLFGRMGATMTASADLLRDFVSMDPEEVMALNPDNFAIPVDSVTRARLDRISKKDHEGDYHGESIELHVETPQRKLKLTINFMTSTPEDILRRSLGNKVVRGKHY